MGVAIGLQKHACELREKCADLGQKKTLTEHTSHSVHISTLKGVLQLKLKGVLQLKLTYMSRAQQIVSCTQNYENCKFLLRLSPCLATNLWTEFSPGLEI